MSETEPNLFALTRVATVLQLNDQKTTVALHLAEPPEDWFRELDAARRLKTGAKREAALGALFAPERLAPMVKAWELPPVDGQAVPCTEKNVLELCGKRRALRLFLIDAVNRSIARVVRKNSNASPAGATGEVPASAPAADD